MSIRNNHWYNLNEQRNYPLDDTASAVSDAGQRLPATLIADLRLRWPVTHGQYAFVSSASVTKHIVTFLVEATDDLDNSSGNSVLLAGVSIPLASRVNGRTYPLDVFEKGVGGFVTIGSGVDKEFTGNFSSPRQSLLTTRAARAARVPPIPSIGIEQASTSLRDVVNLTASAPIELSKETRVIDGVEYDNVIVMRLAEKVVEVASIASADSVYSKYAGPCGKRVGSKSCFDPQPLQTINGITPDCDGVLILEFDGCATVGRNVQDCGVVIDCNMGLSDSCNPPYLPNLQTGELPSELPLVIISPPLPPVPPIEPDCSISEIEVTLLSLPYCDTFDDGIAHGFYPTDNSLFGIIADDSPAERDCCDGPPVSDEHYGCDTSQSVSDSEGGPPGYAEEYYLTYATEYYQGLSVKFPIWGPIPEVASSYGAISQAALSRTNISLFAYDVQTLYRKYTTDLKVIDSGRGSSMKAGIIVNYQVGPGGLITYILTQLDITTDTIGIYYFNGSQLVKLADRTNIGSRAGYWYRMTFAVFTLDYDLTRVLFETNLYGIEEEVEISGAVGQIGCNTWGTDSGLAGLYTSRSNSYFSFWRIDEAS